MSLPAFHNAVYAVCDVNTIVQTEDGTRLAAIRCGQVCFVSRAPTAPSSVIAGLVPAISLREDRRCPMKRDGRDKPGHDNGTRLRTYSRNRSANSTSVLRYTS